MSGVIFISYRRSDAEGEAGRLYDDVVRLFGSGSVFMDVSDIHPGKDFRQVLTDNVSKCAVLLAIIGPNWTSVTDASGARRLDQPNDFVRLEVAPALARGIDVIPVLVHGARMPTAAKLPEDLQNLAYRNSFELTHARWSTEVELFGRTLRDYVHPKRGFTKGSIRNVIGGEDAANKSVVQSAAADPAPSGPAKPSSRFAAGVVLIAAVIVASVWGIVSVHRQPEVRNKDGVHPSRQTSTEGQSAGSSTAPIPSLPTGQATGHSTPGKAGEQALAQGAASTSTPAAASEGGESGSAFLGWWYIADPPKLIPNGTPTVFYIGRHGNQFVVEMHASMGDGGTTTSCGSQYVPLTNNGLSMVWDEPAIPGCHRNDNDYTAIVRLYMVGNDLHMTLAGKYPSTDLVFKHQG
jgi:TIR domain